MSLHLKTTLINAAPQTGGVRFAPSPTGRFHVGNLRTAWISERFARSRRLPWVVRFEDIDQARVLSGAQDLQLADLKALGLVPDVVLVQTHFESRHRQLFDQARKTGAIYACHCSRRGVQEALAGLASASHEGVAPVYSGHCRSTPPAAGTPVSAAGFAWRFKMLGDGARDFIIARTSSLEADAMTDSSFVPAYHWACAIDDFDGAYDLIVRSSDLASALPLQRAIQEAIASWEARSDFNEIAAFHTSLVTRDDGHRLEKRTHGVTWPELVSSGWSADKLLRAFENSFDSELFGEPQCSEHGVSQELSATLSLGRLLPASSINS